MILASRRLRPHVLRLVSENLYRRTACLVPFGFCPLRCWLSRLFFVADFARTDGQRLCGNGDEGGEEEEEKEETEETEEGLDANLSLPATRDSNPPACRWPSVAAAFGDSRPTDSEQTVSDEGQHADPMILGEVKMQRKEEWEDDDGKASAEEEDEEAEESVNGRNREQKPEDEEAVQGSCESACDGAAFKEAVQVCSSNTEIAGEVVDKAT